MHTTHYLEFRSIGGTNGSAHPSGQFQAAAKLLDALHFENVRRVNSGQAALPVAFPDLLSGSRNAMARVRVFGDEPSLVAFKATGAGAGVGDKASAVEASEVSGVPGKHALAAFVRDRRAEKGFSGHADRALSRAQRKVMERIARGDQVVKPPRSSEERLGRVADAAAEGSAAGHVFIRVRSRSTGQAFALFIAPVVSPNGFPESKVDSYGLSRREASFAVPSF